MCDKLTNGINPIIALTKKVMMANITPPTINHLPHIFFILATIEELYIPIFLPLLF
jgi:hypothetical protein